MACYHPLEGWRAPNGGITFDRKSSIGQLLSVPCGQCIGCRLRRSQEWAIRCYHEAQDHAETCFITLTYAPEHLPPGGTLHKPDFQAFLKRLRKNTGKKIRYFHCGEYGEKLSRPHYHACIFGYDFPDKQHWKYQNGYQLHISPELEETWGLGYCTVGELNYETASYTAQYILKKQTGDKSFDHYQRDDPVTGQVHTLEPEYITMSLKPGIGAEWYETFADEVYPVDSVVIKGYEVRPPRYYDKAYERTDPTAYEALKRKRKQLALSHADNQTPERLRVREKVTKARMAENSNRKYENGESIR